jgi:hypothetical protein
VVEDPYEKQDRAKSEKRILEELRGELKKQFSLD